MAIHHGGAGCPLHRGLDILMEDSEHADLDNDSTHNLDATVTLGNPEAVGPSEVQTYHEEDRLTVLSRELNTLCQRVAVEEGQPAETLDCIWQELQNLSIAILQPQPPTPAAPFGEVLHQYMDTLCSTQNQSNLTNSLMHDIPIF